MMIIKIPVRKILKIYIPACLVLIAAAPLSAQDEAPPSVAVFGIPANNTMMNSLTDETVTRIKNIFNNMGRFSPVENFRIINALRDTPKSGDIENVFGGAAGLLKADIYVVTGLYQISNFYYADLRIFAINPAYKGMEKKIVLRSGIMVNITSKIEREVACLHEGLPISAKIINLLDNDLCVINSGQWSGLAEGMNVTSDIGAVKIIEAGRFSSIARISGGKIKKGESFIIRIYPKTGKTTAELEQRLRKSALRKYGLENNLLKEDDPEKKMLESMCIVNIGGNICLPGYGAFLSTYYMGIKEASPSMSGISLSVFAILNQFCLPLFMTGFRANFFPWEKDPDKTRAMQNMHIFLWSTLPVTYSASYIDQLAYQLKKNKLLPPFFEDSDMAASAFSLFIPGGGLFYKGRRTAGWSFYFTEMIIAGYGIYNFEYENRRLYAFAVLGAVKVIDMAAAYFVSSSYDFYNMEMERSFNSTSLGLGMYNNNDEDIYNLMIAYHF